MIRQLERYVLRELFQPFLAALAVLLSLFYAMVLVRGVDFLLGSAAQPTDWVRLVVALLPTLLPQALPIALLLGLMIGFARLGEDRELTAMASVGISPARLAWPALVLSAGTSLLLVLIIFVWKPWGIASMRHTAREVIERNLLGDLKPGALRADLPGIVFHAQDVAPGPQWRQVVLIDERDPSHLQVLSAPSASATFAQGVGLTFRRGLLAQRSGARDWTTVAFDEGTLLFDVDEALQRRDTFKFGHEELSPADLMRRAAEAEAQGQPSAPFWSAFHFRFAQLFAPFALGLVATALAQGSKRRAARTAAVFALGLYLAYYVLVRVGVQLGERGVVAPWVAGLVPTGLTLLAGLALLARVARRGTQ